MVKVIEAAVNWGIGKLWTPKSGDEPPKFTEKSILIAVMGMTGAGKTTFISKTTGVEMEIGHGLKSCTKEIQIASITLDGRDVHLIDTPGFDDTELDDTDILIRIANYLTTSVRLSGIIYLYPMTALRVGGVAVKNLTMFQNLVGDSNMRNVKLVTTMWDGITAEQGKERLEELTREFWRVMTVAGAQVDRCNEAATDGHRIIRSIMNTSPVTLQLQSEMQQGLRLEETAAGKIVRGQLEELEAKYERDVSELRKKLDDATTHGELLAAVRMEYEHKLRKQQEAADQKVKLHEIDIKNLKEKVEDLEKKSKEGGCCIM